MKEGKALLERVCNAFRKCAGDLQPDHPPARNGLRRIHPLRILQQDLRVVLEEAGGEDKLAWTFAFLVDAWIRDYFLNFAGDVLSPASLAIDQIRNQLLQERAVEAFERLAGGLEAEDLSKIIEPLQDLVCSYMEAIRESRVKVGGW